MGKYVVNVRALQRLYLHLKNLDPTVYNYSEEETILGQDYFHAVKPLECNGSKAQVALSPFIFQ